MTAEEKVNAAKSYMVGSLVRCMTHDMRGVCTIIRIGPPPPPGKLGADWATATYDIESAHGERLLGLVATDLVPCLGNPAAVALGRMGGASTSPAKQAASRANGRLGGRPRKAKPEDGAQTR